jgi:Tfp pilus assembly protein PilF
MPGTKQQNPIIIPSILLAILIFLSMTNCTATKTIHADMQFGDWCLERGLWKEAAIRYQAVIEQNPGYAPAHNNLAIAFEATGKFDDAMQEYEKALALDPGNEKIKKNIKEIRSIQDSHGGNNK